MVGYKHDDSLEITKLQDKVLYERPVSNLARPNIALIAGRHAKIKDLSAMYEILLSIGFYPTLIADSTLDNLALPAELIMRSKNNGPYENTDEIIETVLSFNTVIILCGGEINSSMDLLVSHLARQFKKTVAADNIKLFEQDWLAPIKIAFANSKSFLGGSPIINSKAKGLNLKAKYLLDASKKNQAILQASDGQQSVIADYKNPNSVGVINCQGTINPYELAALSIGLMAEKPSHAISKPMEYFLVAGHLYRTIYQKDGLEGLRQFLRSQF